MRYRRRGQQFEPQERSFARKFKYEALKENLGKLVEYGGVGVGALAGTLAAKTGLPLSPTAVTILGAAVGGIAGSTAKASIVSAVDHFLERRDSRRDDHQGREQRVLTATPPGEVPQVVPRAPRPVGQLWRQATSSVNRDRQSGDRRGGTGASAGVGSVIVAIGASISQFGRLEADLARVVQQMRDSQERLTAVLRGGRQETAHRRTLTSAREAVQESVDLISRAEQDLRTYLRSL